MAADCALELKSHNVAYISLWPGSVKTENIGANSGEQKPELDEARGETVKLAANAEVHKTWGVGESIEFSGKCIVALATGMHILRLINLLSRGFFCTFSVGDEFFLQIQKFWKRLERYSPPLHWVTNIISKTSMVRI